MTTEGFRRLNLDTFGGLNTLLDRADIPVGMSPNCSNVEFFPGAVRTRRGFKYYGDLGAAGRTADDFLFVTPPDDTLRRWIQRTTASDVRSGYFLFTPPTTYLASNVFFETGLRTVFLAQDRFAYGAIAKAGTAWHAPVKLDTIPNGGSVRAGRIGNASPGTGMTAGANTAGGTCTPGIHWALMIYETRSGHRSSPMAIPVQIPNVVTGTQLINLLTLPRGDTADVLKRLIFMTPAAPQYGTAPYPLSGYYCWENDNSGMVINNLSASSTIISVTDDQLLAGTSIDQYLDIVPLPPCAGLTTYHNRTVAWGVRNELAPAGLYSMSLTQPPPRGVFGMNNLRLDSYLLPAGAVPAMPTEWQEATAGSANGSFAAGASNYTGNAWVIAQPGVPTAVTGKIQHTMDTFYALDIKKTYSVRFTATLGGYATAPTGTLHVGVVGQPSVDVTLSSMFNAGATNPASSVFKVYEGVLTTGAVTVGSWLQIWVDGTQTSGGYVYIKDLVIFPTDEPIFYNSPLISRAGRPEAFSFLDGFVGLPHSDAQKVTSAFVIRDTLYFARQVSLYSVNDNFTQEPSNWPVRRVSDIVGTHSAHGTAAGDGWAVIAGQNGIYYFDGSQPRKISEEINPTLARVDWANYGHLVYVAIDAVRKLIFVGLPVDGSTSVNLTLAMSYLEGWGDTLSGQYQEGKRKWTTWYGPDGSGGLGQWLAVDPSDKAVVRFDTTNVGGLMKFPATAASPALYLDAVMNAGAAATTYVTSVYETAQLTGNTSEQKLFGYLSLSVNGNGNYGSSLILQAVRSNGNVLAIVNGGMVAVSDPARHDVELMMNLQDERMGIRLSNYLPSASELVAFGTTYMALNRLTLYSKPAASVPVRGR